MEDKVETTIGSILFMEGTKGFYRIIAGSCLVPMKDGKILADYNSADKTEGEVYNVGLSITDKLPVVLVSYSKNEDAPNQYILFVDEELLKDLQSGRTAKDLIVLLITCFIEGMPFPPAMIKEILYKFLNECVPGIADLPVLPAQPSDPAFLQ